MPWKNHYTTSDEIGILDGQIQWPAGQQMGFGLTVNLNPAAGAKGITEKDLAYPTWHFGMNEGLDSFLRLFARTGVKATFAVPAVIAKAYPAQIEKILAAGHEIAAQGLYGEDPNTLASGQEAAHIARATEILTEVTGAAPKGWYSLSRPDDRFATGAVTDDTIALIKAQGYSYFGNGLADDAPYYWVTDAATSESLLALPYYYHFDDTFFLMFPRAGVGLERLEPLKRNWAAEFHAQYRRGRYFNMCVSPARAGWGHRFAALSAFLTEAVSHPGVWTETASVLADYWQSHYPAAETLALEPSIWVDYEDSLS